MNGQLETAAQIRGNDHEIEEQNAAGKPRTALILFASETGTSEDAAQSLGRLFERLRFDVEVKSMDAARLPDLLQLSIVVFTVSTTGQGDIPSNGTKLWKSLLRKNLPSGCLAPVAFTTFGFGDSSYPKFNWAAKKLHKRLEQLGAREVYGRGEADEQHDEGTDGAFLPWSRDLRNWLLENYPLPDGMEVIPDDHFLEPKFVLEVDDVAAADVTTTNASLASDHVHVPMAAETAAVLEPALPSAAGASSESDELEPASVAPDSSIIDSQIENLKSLHLSPEAEDTETDIPPSLLLPIPESHTLKLSSITRLTPDKHWQDVRQLTLTYPGRLAYNPGDIITIYPKNFPSDVSKLIHDQGWDSIADLPLRLCSNPVRYSPTISGDNDGTENQPPVDPTFPRPLTLRNLLIHTLDISKIPSRHFLELCAHFTSDADHKERLLEFSNPAFSDEYYDYCTRPRRSILEVLSDFHSVKLPWRYVLSVLPRMRGRQFSIASGGAHKHITTHCGEETRIDLLIALVKYRTVLRKIREGVCSRYVAALPIGTEIRVTIQKASWDVTKNNYAMLKEPLLCVGPGTGVAPVRALMHERAKVLDVEEHEMGGNAVVIYGGRNKAADYFYGDEWPSLGVECLAAWSRDQREKVYVQDIIRQRPERVWECIGPKHVLSGDGKRGGGGTLFVCGSSGKMPIAVRAAVVDALVKCGLEKDDAEKHLKVMEKGNKYLQETW